MSIMRDIGRTIGHQKNAVRLDMSGLGNLSKLKIKGPMARNLGNLETPTLVRPGGMGGGPAPRLRRPAGAGPGMGGRRPTQQGRAAQQGLLGMLTGPGARNAARTVFRAGKIGVPIGILLNRLIASMGAQDAAAANVNDAMARR